MNFKRFARTAAVALLALCAPVSAQSWFDHLPVPTGTPDGYVEGVFKFISCGADGGHVCGVGFTKEDGKIHSVYLMPEGPLYVDGAKVVCANLPSPIPQMCPRWPKAVVVGKTRIRIPYWWFTRMSGERAVYTDRFSTVK